ncbi:MAG: diguanylate cyclase [Sandaracinaceae bacterium]
MSTSSEPLEILLELTRLLSQDRPLEELLTATTDAAVRLLPADHASVRLLDDDRRMLVASARSGAGISHDPVPFELGEGVLGIVADNGKGTLVVDSSADPRYQERSTGFAIRSLVAVPIRAGAKVVGVLSASSAVAAAFAERDQDLAQLLANCTAPAIETARLARLAVTDDLTRAFNYRYHVSRLAEEVGRAKRYQDRFSVLIMDLDHFKNVNDGWGHLIGDLVLRSFADRVRGEVRESDVFIRRGGEEFVLLMPSSSETEAMHVAERIRTSVAASPIEADWARVPLSVSIGVATWQPGETANEVEARADAALYRAKAAGRDRVEVAA